MSLDPFCAEQMIPHVKKILQYVEQFNDKIIAKVIRNLSLWSRNLQCILNCAIRMSEPNLLQCLTKDPFKYLGRVSCASKDTNEEGKCTYSSKYSSLQLWWSSVDKMASLSADMDREDLGLELLGALNHLTEDDLGNKYQPNPWFSFITENSLLSLAKNILTPGTSPSDLKLEAIILCNQICGACRDCTKLFTLRPNPMFVLVSDMLHDCDDVEIKVQLLCLMNHLLVCNETREELLAKTGE